MSVQQFKLLTVCCVSALLFACGGSSSSSGGPVSPPPPSLPFFSIGEYSGTLILNLNGRNIISEDDQPSSLGLEVLGAVAGMQQVRIAFRQFSGTSAIGPNGGFSIPSGPFRIPIQDRSGGLITTCTGQLLFDGVFAGSSATGTVTVTQDFACEDADFGPLSGDGTFEAAFGASKRQAQDGGFKLYAVKN